tara:strand:+ start:1159 stop:2082 length:924 start_codon:yes stop_codon:yes gene_type:complete
MKEKLSILKEIFGSYYKSHDEYLFSCPFCKHHKKKLSINLDLGVYKCWVCDSKGKNLQRLVRRHASRDLTRQWQLLTNQVDMSEVEDLFEEKTSAPPAQHLTLPAEFTFLGNPNLSYESRRPLRYLKERGITLEDVYYYKLGFCDAGEYKNRIIFPSFDHEGYCNYFVGRSYGNSNLKYKNPKVSRDIIFNELLVDWRKPVVLVEGPFDALKTKNSIPVLGSTLSVKSRLFARLVEEQTAVYIGFDADALQKSLLVIKNMIEYGLEVYRLDTSNIDDIGSLGTADVEKLKDTATLMDFESFVFSSCR